MREKAKVREVKASREMVLCFRLSGISVGWAAEAHEEGEALPIYTLKMSHRAQIAGVCPGAFLNSLEGIALSLGSPEVTYKQL